MVGSGDERAYGSVGIEIVVIETSVTSTGRVWGCEEVVLKEKTRECVVVDGGHG